MNSETQITANTNEINDELTGTETVITTPEVIPSMDEFKSELEASFHKMKEGDLIKVTVIGISDKELTVDLGSYTEGLIYLDELSNDPSFSIKFDVAVGDTFQAIVLNPEDQNGNVILSKKQADSILAWDLLMEDMRNKTKVTVKIKEAVNAGVICYYRGIRGFIPASQITLSYVEQPSEWVGKTITAVITTADRNQNKLVLSGKEVEREYQAQEKTARINRLQKGIVTKGTVEKITPYGAFVRIGDGLSGLVHISQICEKHIKSPNEVIKLEEEVTVKIIDIKDGKISLSIKAALEDAEQETMLSDVEEAPTNYSTGEEATTGLGDLLKNIRL